MVLHGARESFKGGSCRASEGTQEERVKKCLQCFTATQLVSLITDHPATLTHSSTQLPTRLAKNHRELVFQPQHVVGRQARMQGLSGPLALDMLLGRRLLLLCAWGTMRAAAFDRRSLARALKHNHSMRHQHAYPPSSSIPSARGQRPCHDVTGQVIGTQKSSTLSAGESHRIPWRHGRFNGYRHSTKSLGRLSASPTRRCHGRRIS